MSYYALGKSYSSALHAADEAMMSTRVFGIACRMLDAVGVTARLHSVDIRDWDTPPRSLMTDLGLDQYWDRHFGTDSIGWLREFEGEIDVLLVDSNHTYHHVKGELDACAPKMAERSAIIVDNCYSTIYRTGSDYMADEDAEGIRRGGEYGAVLEFLNAHPEWIAHWAEPDVVVLTKGWSLPGSSHHLD